MKSYLKNLCIWVLVLTMILPGPMTIFAQKDQGYYNDLTKDKNNIISKEPVKPAKLENGQTAEGLIKNPDQPAIYTLRTDYKVQKGEKYEIDYQPYIASVGAAATKDEQKR